jgi:hypothetical protein
MAWISFHYSCKEMRLFKISKIDSALSSLTLQCQYHPEIDLAVISLRKKKQLCPLPQSENNCVKRPSLIRSSGTHGEV